MNGEIILTEKGRQVLLDALLRPSRETLFSTSDDLVISREEDGSVLVHFENFDLSFLDSI